MALVSVNNEFSRLVFVFSVLLTCFEESMRMTFHELMSEVVAAVLVVVVVVLK
jgi:hypothetical protein